MKKFSKLIALVLVLSLVFAFTACGKGGSDDTIKLGILCSLTGNSQTNGGYAQQGAKMAVEEINAAGGINGKQIELVIEDDGGKADTAINAYNKL
ncbi:MAG: ABC transporter substrate-binding protein, partial [Oscillospiraceae bacterium]